MRKGYIPRKLGAYLSDGKNSKFNYLDILINKRIKRTEIYLIINGPGFKLGRVEKLQDQLEEVGGIHVVDLHKCDWGIIDQGRKIDLLASNNTIKICII